MSQSQILRISFTTSRQENGAQSPGNFTIRQRLAVNMNEEILQFPQAYRQIDEATKLSGFTMASDVLTGALLRTLSSSKPYGHFLELGTGTGLSTAWILDGMGSDASMTSVDNDPQLLEIAQTFLGGDKRLNLVCADGEAWIKANEGKQYDFIFADTWHGKYLLLEEVLTMVKQGGIYFVDDMLPQRNWPDGHKQKVENLVRALEARKDFTVTKQRWSTGIVIAVKK